MGPLKTDGYDLEAIARQFGTPLFVFSGDAIRERVREFRAAFAANSVASMRPMSASRMDALSWYVTLFFNRST